MPTLLNIALEPVVRQILGKAEEVKIGHNPQLEIIAYTDDVVIIAENQESLKKSTRELIRIAKEIGLNINEEKTKYLILSRQLSRIRSNK